MRSMRLVTSRTRGRTLVNKTYTYYMQNLNRLISENRSLETENKVLKEENAIVKERISQLDENVVKRVAE